MNAKTDHLISAEGFARVARNLARQSDVTVRLKGGNAYTDGKEIVLPVPVTMDERTQNILLGFLIHESGHVRGTDFKVPVTGLTNLFEDHRIERNMRCLFKGAEDYLIKAHKSFWDDWAGRIQEGIEVDAFGAAHNWLLAFGQKITMGRAVPKVILDQVEKDLVVKWGPIQKALIPFLERSAFTGSTQDAKKLSDQVLALLKSWQPPEDQPSEPDQGTTQSSDDQPDQQDSDSAPGSPGSEDSSQTDDESEASGVDGDAASEDVEPDASGDSDDMSDDSAGDEGAASSHEAADHENTDDQLNGSHSASSSEAGTPDLDATKMELQDALDAGVKAKDFGEFLLESVEDVIEEARMNGELLDYETHTYTTGSVDTKGFGINNDVLQQSKVAARGLRRAVKTMVEAVTRAKHQTGRRGRRIDARRISRIAVSDNRIFSKRTEGISIDTAITIAVDMSGSMGKMQRDEKAMAATLGLAQVLHQTRGTSVRATTFPGYGRDVGQIIPRGIPPCESICGLKAHGGTPIVQAVTDATDELRHQMASKKVLIVITDGEVDPGQVVAIKSIVGNDIDTYWIGIGVSHLPFDHAICVEEPDQLGSALLRHASDLIGSAA